MTVATMRHSSDAEVAALVSGFESRTLPRAEWTHAAHLAFAAWLHLTREPSVVLRDIRLAILRWAEHHGVRQTPSGGYHETLTRFYCWAVGEVLANTDEMLPRFERVNLVVEQLADRKIPLRYYTESRLMSWEARVTWVEPDVGTMAR